MNWYLDKVESKVVCDAQLHYVEWLEEQRARALFVSSKSRR